MARDHKVKITTVSGETHTKSMTAEDAAAAEDLPFTSSNIAAVSVTPPGGDR